MPSYLKRWLAQGRKPNGDTASTIFDLQHDYRHVIVYPATRDNYAVTIGAAGARTLASSAQSGNACVVPAKHLLHGVLRFGLRPHDEPSGPMELYLVLPREEVNIVYRHDRRRQLTEILTELAASLVP